MTLPQISKECIEAVKGKAEQYNPAVYAKIFIDEITTLQEKYADNYGKNEAIKSDSIKRKERIKNIDIELENWKALKSNSEKMIIELTQRKDRIKNEIRENQKNPEITIPKIFAEPRLPMSFTTLVFIFKKFQKSFIFYQ